MACGVYSVASNKCSFVYVQAASSNELLSSVAQPLIHQLHDDKASSVCVCILVDTLKGACP